ncbi:MAG: hypothetical protein JWP89_3684 [Schlesneria sp.]|nr:hypothetical protein [Schlesneria sp.]
MAGDWIKVEKASGGKPEVLRIAELLHVHPTHAFGLCVQFWCWCDDQMTNGDAMSVTYQTLDALLGHQGFCEALVKVGWMTTRYGRIRVTNFDRHLSESSKKRALANNRKQGLRERSTKATRVPREEKKREEKKVSKKEENAPSFRPPTVEEIRDYCTARNSTVDPEQFRDFYESKGWLVGAAKMKDWKAALRNWEKRDHAERTQGRKQTSLESNLSALQRFAAGDEGRVRKGDGPPVRLETNQ